MDALLIREWLDEMTSAFSRLRLMRTLCAEGGEEIATNLNIPGAREIHLWCSNGISIERIADALGLPCETEEFDDRHVHKSFYYKGFKVFALVDKKEEF